MRSLFYITSALAVIALAFWAYRENYRTQQVLAETEDLQQQISRARQRLRVLNAEWAYLNRPDRLRALAEMNFDKLGLLPLQPSQFGMADQVAFPRRDRLPVRQRLPISQPVDVSNMDRAEAQE
ncbi:cell division protein FtsL [Roseovarius salinarum]|uniref:cell division protein FtsL n=1 Tax=Roseovarius salinarum TaxID=1981892 RepID=UPI0018E45A5E|nr:cell division protein FtsL [Roseovarius salinarum]